MGLAKPNSNPNPNPNRNPNQVCNHPHLLTWDEREGKRMDDQPEGMHYGDWQLSGKMHVLRQVHPNGIGLGLGLGQGLGLGFGFGLGSGLGLAGSSRARCTCCGRCTLTG